MIPVVKARWKWRKSFSTRATRGPIFIFCCNRSDKKKSTKVHQIFKKWKKKINKLFLLDKCGHKTAKTAIKNRNDEGKIMKPLNSCAIDLTEQFLYVNKQDEKKKLKMYPQTCVTLPGSTWRALSQSGGLGAARWATSHSETATSTPGSKSWGIPCWYRPSKIRKETKERKDVTHSNQWVLNFNLVTWKTLIHKRDGLL